MCLSDKCLKEKHLVMGSRYIRKNNKLPKFHESVVAKANELISSISDSQGEYSQSFEFSNSFFDFQGLKGGKGETVQVHAIGKPLGEGKDGTAPVSNLGARGSTYQVLSWEIGKEITFDEADLHMDDEGNIYVWFRWMGSGWNWKPVSQDEFNRLRALERSAES